MPDCNGLGIRALEALHHSSLLLRISFLEMAIEGTQDDSIRAAQRMNEAQVDCIVTLGGDGTNRVVSKTCGEVPLIPISTGTNNVFPVMNEGTTAGMAAGILAKKVVNEKIVTTTMKKIKISAGGKEKDLALIDAVAVTEYFAGARAIWDLEKVKLILLTRAEPGSIGFSSIGAALLPVGVQDPFGLLIELGSGGEKIQAPIAPGVIMNVKVKSYRVLEPEEIISIELSPSMIALDGEREIEVNSNGQFELVLAMDGPIVGDIPKILQEATKMGFFRMDGKRRKAGGRESKSG
jgi:predicted polyphosphate/ATP-dependent NAD kinase